MKAPFPSELLERARATGDFNTLLHSIPFAKFLGLTVDPSHKDHRVQLKGAPHITGNPVLPAVHGGALGALLEMTGLLAVMIDTSDPRPPKTISVTVEYLRSARIVDTWAKAEIVRHGRRVATVRCIAWQEDPAKPVATANLQLLLPS